MQPPRIASPMELLASILNSEKEMCDRDQVKMEEVSQPTHAHTFSVSTCHYFRF